MPYNISGGCTKTPGVSEPLRLRRGAMVGKVLKDVQPEMLQVPRAPLDELLPVLRRGLSPPPQKETNQKVTWSVRFRHLLHVHIDEVRHGH